MSLSITEKEDACTFRARIVPRSARNEVAGSHGEATRMKLVAPPVDGKANQALRAFWVSNRGPRHRRSRLLPAIGRVTSAYV